MTRKERRIAVVKDCLKRLRYMNVKKGVYLRGQFKSDNLQKDVNKLAKECKSCALGSLFLSHIGLYNNVLIEELELGTLYGYQINNNVQTDRDFILEKIGKYFSEKQLDLIEEAFEAPDYLYGYWSYTKAEIFGMRFKNLKLRLRRILENILENDGLFKP